MTDLLIGMDIIADGDFVISSNQETGEMHIYYSTPGQGITKVENLAK
ncbi:hypothetical protein IJ103_00685 [Candidatus Saccharibacteria bacterium]|nr:hypothetical protein [Candidatus Saccharibacteria bacterium]MBQ9016748.1 hypothetical protein [Candidatus Saccharibacteria bacterium]